MKRDLWAWDMETAREHRRIVLRELKQLADDAYDEAATVDDMSDESEKFYAYAHGLRDARAHILKRLSVKKVLR